MPQEDEFVIEFVLKLIILPDPLVATEVLVVQWSHDSSFRIRKWAEGIEKVPEDRGQLQSLPWCGFSATPKWSEPELSAKPDVRFVFVVLKVAEVWPEVEEEVTERRSTKVEKMSSEDEVWCWPGFPAEVESSTGVGTNLKSPALVWSSWVEVAWSRVGAVEQLVEAKRERDLKYEKYYFRIFH